MMVLFSDPTKEPSTMIMISTIGLDIAKNSFSGHGFDTSGVTAIPIETASPGLNG